MPEQDDDFVPEEEAEGGAALVAGLREKLKKAIAEKQEYANGWQRERADFANFRKEEAARMSESEARLIAKLVEPLIPALDSLEMAFKQKQTKELNLIHKQILDALRSLGVEAFGKAGEQFDPHRHEALVQREEGDTVVSVERSGYSIGERIIRPAQVMLGAN